MSDILAFVGFDTPQQNWSRLPHQFVNLLNVVDSIAELKVTIYILRHTWGFSEYEIPVHLTTDEIANGRKYADGSRMDNGTGLSEPAIRSGIDLAIERGTIDVFMDDSDPARIQKFYGIKISEIGGKSFTPGTGDRGKKIYPRSVKETNKETSSPRKGEKDKTVIPAVQMNPMKDAIVRAFKFNWETMTRGEKGQVQQSAHDLCEAKRIPEDIPLIYAYCEHNYDHFSPLALPTNATKALQTGIMSTDPLAGITVIRAGA